MNLEKHIHGFTLLETRALPELEARMVLMEHDQSGARLVWLDREEENKTFSIAFRTLPEDDTGVFHILEHSVLCGSDRYPVKEPFVELMKGSMQTFLNAMTYPDKTMYPVSSRNDKDFMNLVRVYMDAVLHPLIYHKPEILRQEGWHYEFSEGQTEPTYKGVVFNEMKGAYGDKQARIMYQMNRALFPENAYRFESGGNPAHIPELTYEQFIRTHQRFYDPSNSYIYLDGRMDFDAVLAALDGEYLNAYTRRDDQPQFTAQPPVKSELIRASYEISPEEPKENKAQLSWGCVYGRYDSLEESTAMEAIGDALCGGSDAPLRRRLVSGGLAQNISLSPMDEMYQPYAWLYVENMDENRVDEVEEAIRDELSRLVREGLDHEQLAATLANMEFKRRERDYNRVPQGLAMGMYVMSSWLYGGDPAAPLEVGPLFERLNKKLEAGWFEALLERTFLKNDHFCRVLMTPSATLGEEERAAEAARLKTAKESWSPEEEAEIRAQQKALEQWHNCPDAPEDLAKIPMLKLSDIPAEPEKLPIEEDSIGDVPLLRHAVPTGGIGYVTLYFDANDLTEEELPCASLLCTLLGEMDTRQYSGAQLLKLRRSLTGAMKFSVEAYGKVNRPNEGRVFLCASFSAVEAKLEKASALMADILTGSQFDNKQRLRELLRQCANDMEASAANSGHVFSTTRVNAGLSVSGAAMEHTAGITFCQWLKDTEKSFEDRSDGLIAALKALCEKLFTTGRLTVSVTGSEAKACGAVERALLTKLPRTERRDIPCSLKPWGTRKEGVVVPADVSYAALGGSLLDQGAAYDGRLLVASAAVHLNYLWNAVRVQGGAYGVGLQPGGAGTACFWSFRDPTASRTLGCYRQTADFLRQFAASDPDLTGLITGAVAKSDPLMTPGRKGEASDRFYWSDVTHEDRCRRRQEMLATTPADLAALADPMEKLTNAGGICVTGSRKLVEACGGELENIITL